MNEALSELERLAREATREGTLSWWTEHPLRYHLRVCDGTCPESDPPYIAAASPAVILRLVAIAKAAQKVTEQRVDDVSLVGGDWRIWDEFNADLAALREALEKAE